jgi:Serine endopeptidase inhibitors
MNTNTETTTELVPFFAQFLEEQEAQKPGNQWDTLKYPSDWEER